MSGRSDEILDTLNSHIGYAIPKPMHETDGLKRLLNNNQDLDSAIETVADEIWNLDPSGFLERANRLTKVSDLLEWIDDNARR